MTRAMIRFVLALLLAQAVIAGHHGFAAEGEPAPLPADPQNTLYLDLDYGRVVIRMRPDLAPKHVARIKDLVRDGFYDGLAFHRVIDHFVAQAGDPKNDGTGGTGRLLKAEFTRTPQVRAVVSMARTSKRDSADSEWFIVLADSRTLLDNQYTMWGEVTAGMEFVDMIRKGNSATEGKVSNPDRIVRMQVAADADRTDKRPNAELLKGPDAATAARNFSAAEFRCVALDRGAGITTQAALAQLWSHGFLAGRYKAQNTLTFAGDPNDADVDTALVDLCTTSPGTVLYAASGEVAKTARALSSVTPAFSTTTYKCKDYVTARKGANKDQADLADLWAFALVEGYKSVSSPKSIIAFENRVKVMDAVAKACGKNAEMSFLDLMSLVAAKVVIK